MHHEFIAIPDAEIPQAIEPIFQHILTTYANETNKTVSMKGGCWGHPHIFGRHTCCPQMI